MGPTTGNRPPGEAALDGIVVVLHEPQDLVNIALVVRAMKNMGLSRLRLVRPAEFDERRIDGIAHDTSDVVSRIEIRDTLDEALEGAVRVVGTSARRRAARQQWSRPAGAAPRLVRTATRGDVVLVFGREDFGLSNDALDRCEEVVSIPTSPDHPSMNLGHAAVIVFYELRRAAEEAFGVEARTLARKKRDLVPPARAEELERFFAVWEKAMRTIRLLRPGTPWMSKMRSFRGIFHRADLDRRELRLMSAVAYRIVHHGTRLESRLRRELGADGSDGARDGGIPAQESDDSVGGGHGPNPEGDPDVP